MNRIDKKFKELRRAGKKAFIAYITAGDPSLAMTEKLVIALEKAGVDILELGIPFSDPLADGPTIQAASERALRKGATLAGIFNLMARIRPKTEMPIAFMTYYNPVFKYGLERFFRDCGQKGVDGVIIPDLSVEEAPDAAKFGKKSGVATIFLAAPTSTKDRMRRIAKISKGFIYYVSLTGVTGARKELPAEIISKVRSIKSLTDKPVAVGFGISNLNQAAEIAKAADGVIVGSAIVKIIGEGKDVIRKVSAFAKKLAKAIHGV